MTDFLNASYYAWPESERDVDDLRLAHGIITTRWARSGGRRLGARDVIALHRAYGSLRVRGRGRLHRDALTMGSRSLLGEWFADARADDGRRAYGAAFATPAQRSAFVPERRLARAALGPLSPPKHAPAEQHWATYDPVRLPNPDAALRLLLDPARRPDIGSRSGRFTALRSSGLLGQSFEIEVVAEPAPRAPVFTRGYVTCTALHLGDETTELAAAVADLAARHGPANPPGSPSLLPEDADPLALVVLTTHEGHFLGRAISHLLVWRDAGGAWIRDVGAWDPLPPHMAIAYVAAGRAAQHGFWGPDPADTSMLAQLALISAGLPVR